MSKPVVKTEREDSRKPADPDPSQNVIEIPVPRILRGSAFHLYANGGPGRLLSRLAQEDRLGPQAPTLSTGLSSRHSSRFSPTSLCRRL